MLAYTAEKEPGSKGGQAPPGAGFQLFRRALCGAPRYPLRLLQEGGGARARPPGSTAGRSGHQRAGSSGFPGPRTAAAPSGPGRARERTARRGAGAALGAAPAGNVLAGCGGSGGMSAACVTKCTAEERGSLRLSGGLRIESGPGERGRGAKLLIPLLVGRCRGVPKDCRGLGRAQSRN